MPFEGIKEFLKREYVLPNFQLQLDHPNNNVGMSSLQWHASLGGKKLQGHWQAQDLEVVKPMTSSECSVLSGWKCKRDLLIPWSQIYFREPLDIWQFCKDLIRLAIGNRRQYKLKRWLPSFFSHSQKWATILRFSFFYNI